MDRKVVRVAHDGASVTAFVAVDSQGRVTRYFGSHFLSTLPIRNLIRAMEPPRLSEVIAAAESLRYRDFLTVVLIVDRAETFPDNWVYVHEPEVGWDVSRTSRTGRPNGPRPDPYLSGDGVLLHRRRCLWARQRPSSGTRPARARCIGLVGPVSDVRAASSASLRPTRSMTATTAAT